MEFRVTHKTNCINLCAKTVQNFQLNDFSIFCSIELVLFANLQLHFVFFSLIMMRLMMKQGLK